MSRLRRDISEREQIPLVHCRIEAARILVVVGIMSPGCHSAYGARRSVAVVNRQTQTFAREVGLHALERFSCLSAQDTFGGAIAREEAAGEVIARCVSDILMDGWIHIAQIDKARRQHLSRERS